LIDQQKHPNASESVETEKKSGKLSASIANVALLWVAGAWKVA